MLVTNNNIPAATATFKETTPLQGAVAMARRGLRITPLRGKAPFLTGWQESATTDIAQIKSWSEQFPGCNFGCVFKKGEFWGLDEDIAGVVDMFVKETGISIETFRVESSAGRCHWYFKSNADSDARLTNISQNNFAACAASVRFHNEQCVAAFSIHPEKLTVYRPVGVPAPAIAEAPKEFVSWLLDQRTVITKQPSPAQQSSGQPRQQILQGSRDSYLFTRAASLRAKGLEQDEIEAVILRENEELCAPPMSIEEAKKCARQGSKYEKGDPTPTTLIGGKLPGEAVVQPKQSQQPQQPNIEIIPAGKFKNPVKVKKSLAEYPLWVWEGTLYEEFAELCSVGNFIPKEFFLEAIKTIVGAVCGHRIQPENANWQQPARFYEVLIGPGSIGKSTAARWGIDMFIGTGLLYDLSQTGAYTNIGCAMGVFASDSGLKKNGFSKHDRILQFYDEFTTLIEKFSINGSGGTLQDVTNQLYEFSPVYPVMNTKTDKVTEVPAREVHNTIIGCTTPLRWRNAFLRSNVDSSGFMQRLNIISNYSKKRVAELKVPDLREFRDKLIKKIQCLEFQKASVVKTPEAVEMFNNWLVNKEKTEEWQNLPDDIKGRINVLIQRNVSHLAWFMGGEDIVPNAEKANEVIEIQCDEDIMARAIALAEYEVPVRQLHQPPKGDNEYALMENSIKLYFVENGGADVTRNMLFRELHADRIGIQIFNKCLTNLVEEGILKIGINEGETRRGRKAQVIQWVGDEGA